MAQFLHYGESIDYTPGSAKTSGDVVVQNDLVGVVINDIPANTLGAIKVKGVFAIAKAAEAIAVGEKVWWDGTNDRVTKTKGVLTVLAGKAVVAAVSGDATVAVLLNEGPSA
jgi:predicted RecA/RadA family phage recombinase